ncbi:hypothetical protein N9043_00615 [bacterium]|nr:hypothetical protein [bacterium]
MDNFKTPQDKLADFVGVIFSPLTHEFKVGKLKVDLLDVIIVVGYLGLMTVAISNIVSDPTKSLSGLVDSMF